MGLVIIEERDLKEMIATVLKQELAPLLEHSRIGELNNLVTIEEGMALLHYSRRESFNKYCKRHGIDPQVCAGKNLYSVRALLRYEDN